MIKRIYSKIIEVLYTIRLSRRVEKLVLEQGYHPVEAINHLTNGKTGNKYVTQTQVEHAVENIKRYLRPMPTPTP